MGLEHFFFASWFVGVVLKRVCAVPFGGVFPERFWLPSSSSILGVAAGAWSVYSVFHMHSKHDVIFCLHLSM